MGLTIRPADLLGAIFVVGPTGRIELGALAYFAVAPLLALAGATHVIAGRGSGGRGRVRSLIIATGSLLIGAGVIAAAARLPFAIDTTAAREHSLDQETIAALLERKRGERAPEHPCACAPGARSACCNCTPIRRTDYAE